MLIGSIQLDNPLFLAPMAGITDRPFRMLCKKLGAGYAVSEMIASKPDLRNTSKTRHRSNHIGESGPIAVQITGTEPLEMANAARFNIDCGAQIIDINMGCPAKKVCQKWAGSALMQNEELALAIIESVVSACSPHGVAVTLKMRTGWSQQARNAPSLALKAQNAGIAMLCIHGRTREQGYRGEAEYDIIAAVKSIVQIPVVANGDIDTPAKASYVLKKTRADALMIGRAAQGHPWIFREIAHYLQTGVELPPPATTDVRQWMLEQLAQHYALYGEYMGVRSARKHIAWLVRGLPDAKALCQHINKSETIDNQLYFLKEFLDLLALTYPVWPQAGILEANASSHNSISFSSQLPR